jgi:hypothetical protein
MSKEIIAPNKQIVSPQGQAVSSRPAMSDQQAIEVVLGNYIKFLQHNGIPTPSKAELRMLLYEKCYTDFIKVMREQEQEQLAQLKDNLPRLQRAAAIVDEEDRKAKEEAEKNKPKLEVVEGGKPTNAKETEKGK